MMVQFDCPPPPPPPISPVDPLRLQMAPGYSWSIFQVLCFLVYFRNSPARASMLLSKVLTAFLLWLRSSICGHFPLPFSADVRHPRLEREQTLALLPCHEHPYVGAPHHSSSSGAAERIWLRRDPLYSEETGLWRRRWVCSSFQAP